MRSLVLPYFKNIENLCIFYSIEYTKDIYQYSMSYKAYLTELKNFYEGCPITEIQ